MSGDRAHWDEVYRNRPIQGASWYRPHLDVSLSLLRQAGLDTAARVIDIGAGASTLVDDLLGLGLRDVTVLDLSDTALAASRERLGPHAASVRWLAADVLQTEFSPAAFDLWHDRAVLHFLATLEDAARYVAQAARAVRPGGHAVIGGFAPEGPPRCSGLPVTRRSAAELAALFAPAFRLLDQRSEQHLTPAGTTQAFTYVLLARA